jgi:hypothetical protein
MSLSEMNRMDEMGVKGMLLLDDVVIVVVILVDYLIKSNARVFILGTIRNKASSEKRRR